MALFEVLLCSGAPTQLVIASALTLAGHQPFVDGVPQPGAVFALALLDSCVLIGLIFLLLHARGERPVHVFLGLRSVPREALFGVLLVPALLIGVSLTVWIVRLTLPWMQNVAVNPFERLIRTPGDAALFAVVATIAGGLREEIQRAFLLRRFEQHLGGPLVGLLIVSAAFGAGHVLQGWDAAVVTALLGLTWGLIYLRRRSIVAPVVSHAGYNAVQVAQVLILRELAPVA
jgi:membrane protease YdiL (CAAX protease family)